MSKAGFKREVDVQGTGLRTSELPLKLSFRTAIKTEVGVTAQFPKTLLKTELSFCNSSRPVSPQEEGVGRRG